MIFVAKIKLKKWDSAAHLKTDEDMVLYLEACLEEAGDDAAFIAKALGNIARAKGMTQLAACRTHGRNILTDVTQACKRINGFNELNL